MYLSWTPTRALVGAGSDGKIEIDLEQYDRKPQIEARESRSISGTTETVLHRIDNIITVQTVPTNDSGLLAKFREFNASVAAGELFSFDAYGTELSPDNVVSCQLIANSYAENRVATLYYSYAFQFREL